MGMIKLSSFLRAGSEFLDLMESLLCKSSLRSYFAELVSSFIFVFAGVGSTMSSSEFFADNSLINVPVTAAAQIVILLLLALQGLLIGSESEAATAAEAHLLTVAIAHAFAMSAAVSLSAHISGCHVNPAVTFGLLVGGLVSFLTALCYIVAQLLGSSLACALLTLVSEGQAIPVAGLSPQMPVSGSLAVEGIATFAVVCTVYGARDPKNESQRVTGPVAIGFILGANIIVTGPFTGGFMNPAQSFGPALMSGNFGNHWVCWVGPFLGGGVAGFVCRSFLVQSSGNQQADANVAV